jgi:hypothetical protein
MSAKLTENSKAPGEPLKSIANSHELPGTPEPEAWARTGPAQAMRINSSKAVAAEALLILAWDGLRRDVGA